MPALHETYESLPYIDLDVSTQAHAEVDALIANELSRDYAGTPHPLLPAFRSPKLSLNGAEVERVVAKQPSTAINVSRYETLDPPATTDPTSDKTNPELLRAWETTLKNAYASSTYLHTRLQSLALLDKFGKNAWLIGNAQLENILKGIEKELLETKEQIEEVSRARRSIQEGVKGEMDGLSEGWKKSIGRLVEVQLAAEQARRDSLAKRREGAA